MNSHFTNFQTWTKGRRVEAIGTNHGSPELPFQNWRSFKEAFAPELIEMAARETACDLGERITHLIDPFGGSGTSALAAQFLGILPTTIEVNPYLADLIEAKVARYDFDEIANSFAIVRELVADTKPSSAPLPGMPQTFVEPGRAGRFIFSLEVAQRLDAYINAIAKVNGEEIQRLFRVLLAGTLLPLSNVVVSGKGRRYRRGGVNKSATPEAVDALFRDKYLSALFDLRRFENREQQGYRVLRGDARIQINECKEAQLAVFSPPYPNSFDYTDVYNVELWVLGYLKDSESNKSLRNATLRSHVQVKRDMSALVDNATLSDVAARLRLQQSNLWSKDIPSMVEAYFADMTTILQGLSNVLAKRGRVYMIVGDSRYAGITVPVAEILCELAPETGFEIVRSNPFRSMRASPQQGGRKELPETLIALSKRH